MNLLLIPLPAPRILLLEPLHAEAEALLSANGGFALVSALDEETILREGASTEAIIARPGGRLTRRILEGCPKLRCVARCGVGYDNVDVDAATQLGLPVLYTPGVNVQSTAEHTLMLLLAVSRQAQRMDPAVKSGNWKIRDAVMGMELGGKRLGIIGLGAIGTRFAEMAEGLGMEVAYWSRSSRDPRFHSLSEEELLATSDVVSLHIALNAETLNWMNADRFGRMKPAAIFLNTGRGGLVDETALADALRNGHLFGAGLDVLAQEPPPSDHPLFRLPNLVITPHTGGLTEEAFRRASMNAATDVLRLLNGEKVDPAHIVNAEALGLA